MQIRILHASNGILCGTRNARDYKIVVVVSDNSLLAMISASHNEGIPDPRNRLKFMIISRHGLLLKIVLTLFLFLIISITIE